MPTTFNTTVSTSNMPNQQHHQISECPVCGWRIFRIVRNRAVSDRRGDEVVPAWLDLYCWGCGRWLATSDLVGTVDTASADELNSEAMPDMTSIAWQRRPVILS